MIPKQYILIPIIYKKNIIKLKCIKTNINNNNNNKIKKKKKNVLTLTIKNELWILVKSNGNIKHKVNKKLTCDIFWDYTRNCVLMIILLNFFL